MRWVRRPPGASLDQLILRAPTFTGTQFRGGEILIVLANVLWTWMSIAAQRWLN